MSGAGITAVGWTDYVCPWCWLGLDRTNLLRSLGVAVEMLPFELHPEIPPGGLARRPGGRLDRTFDRIAAECESLGRPFQRPARVPNSHRALETAEVVRRCFPEAFETFDESLYRLHWVEGGDIEDPDQIVDRLRAAGAPPEEVAELVADGVGARGLAESMTEARDHGVTATPAWLLNDTLLIPGAQPRETIERWVRRLSDRTAT